MKFDLRAKPLSTQSAKMIKDAAINSHVMAMRAHARFAAKRIVRYIVDMEVNRRDAYFLQQGFWNARLERYKVNPLVFSYARKVIKEKLKEEGLL